METRQVKVWGGPTALVAVRLVKGTGAEVATGATAHLHKQTLKVDPLHFSTNEVVCLCKMSGCPL